MKIINKTLKSIKENPNLNKKFLSLKRNDFKLDCNILTKTFYLDSYNYFPITDDYNCFLDLFKWGDESKYKNFHSNNFLENFKNNLGDFSILSDVFVLGSSPMDNYYRNMISFLPRIFFIEGKKIKIAIHRNTSNKFRNFIRALCKKMNIEMNFIFLDNSFYKFANSKIPQFFNKEHSYKILNSLKATNRRKERIYVTRHNCLYRNLINEGNLIDKLKEKNFRTIDLNSTTIFQQIKTFSNAEIVIGPTGSGLTNIVFCNSGTKVIEISPNYKFDYENNFLNRYKNISSYLNLNYKRIVADPINLNEKDKKVEKFISSKIISESNYYKNMLLKIEKIDSILQF